MNLMLRTATTADAALIADVSRQTFYDTFAPHNTEADMKKFLDEQFTKGRLMLEVGAPDNEFFLAYAGEQVAGYLKLRDAKVPDALKGILSLEVARLYVLKEFLGKRVGAFLMDAAIETAVEKGKQVLWLGVWEANGRAIAFYERYGFKKFGEWDFLLGDDMQRDWLMKKELKEEDR